MNKFIATVLHRTAIAPLVGFSFDGTQQDLLKWILQPRKSPSPGEDRQAYNMSS